MNSDPLIKQGREVAALARISTARKTRLIQLANLVDNLCSSLEKVQNAYIELERRAWAIDAYNEITGALQAWGIEIWSGVEDGERWRWKYGNDQGINDTIGKAIIAGLIAAGVGRLDDEQAAH